MNIASIKRKIKKSERIRTLHKIKANRNSDSLSGAYQTRTGHLLTASQTL